MADAKLYLKSVHKRDAPMGDKSPKNKEKKKKKQSNKRDKNKEKAATISSLVRPS